jgi:hypothetical protein
MSVRASRAAAPHPPSVPSPPREKKNKKKSRRPVFLAGDVSRKVALDGRLILAASSEKAPDARCTAVLPWPAGSRPYFPVARAVPLLSSGNERGRQMIEDSHLAARSAGN